MAGRKSAEESKKLTGLDKEYIEKVFEPEVEKRGIANVKRVKGAFGIVKEDGQEEIVLWVESSLARKVPPQEPFALGGWAQYQFDSMFAGW